MTSHHVQGWTRAGAGVAPVLRRHEKPASVIAHDQFQFPPRLASLGRGHSRSRSTLRAFYTSCARRVGIPNAAPRRLALALLPERGAIKFVRAVMAARCFCVPEHFDCQVSYRSERHVRLSKFVGFNADEPTEKMSGTILYQYGEFLKFGLLIDDVIEQARSE